MDHFNLIIYYLSLQLTPDNFTHPGVTVLAVDGLNILTFGPL
jgi:hypothetical protein